MFLLDFCLHGVKDIFVAVDGRLGISVHFWATSDYWRYHCYHGREIIPIFGKKSMYGVILGALGIWFWELAKDIMMGSYLWLVLGISDALSAAYRRERTVEKDRCLRSNVLWWNVWERRELSDEKH